MPAYEGISIWVADADSGVIYGATDSSMIDRTLEDIGFTKTDIESGITVREEVQIEGYRNYCSFSKTGDAIVVVAISAKASIKSNISAMLIELVYLLLAGFIIIYMIKKVLKANVEKDAQMEVVISMADIYTSMHLIDLENNTVAEYNAFGESGEDINYINDADEMIRKMVSLITEAEDSEAALTFTDLHTLAQRMKHKKIISEEFISKTFGWYRASFITIKADEEGYPTKVIYVTRNIDKQKKKEEALIIQSNTDEQTGLYNRRAYEADIEEQDDHITEENFVFVSLDVNGLKAVNDKLGHIAGDELLIGAADCMKQCFGPYGKIYRIGGDEFAAIIFVDEAQLQSIKKEFESLTTQWVGHLVDHLSISCGYVTKHEAQTNSVRDIARIADKEMYKVKSAYYRKG
jgi:diguanylate cyclase (GGDEF)-like protein